MYHLEFVGGTESWHHKHPLCVAILFIKEILLLSHSKCLSSGVRHDSDKWEQGKCSSWLTVPKTSAGPADKSHQGAVGLLVISSPSFAALLRSFRSFLRFCESWLVGRGRAACLVSFCSLHYHADNIRLFSRKAWDPCSFPRLSSQPLKKKNNEGPVRLCLAVLWADADVTAEPGSDWLQPNWSCSVHAWSSNRQAATSHLSPGLRTKAPGGKHWEVNKAPAEHEAGAGGVPTSTPPLPRAGTSLGPLRWRWWWWAGGRACHETGAGRGM